MARVERAREHARSIIIEADEHGGLHIPPEALGEPHRRFRFQVEEEGYSLKPMDEEEPLWKTLTPEQRVEDLRHWVASKKPIGARPIPAEALRREPSYG